MARSAFHNLTWIKSLLIPLILAGMMLHPPEAFAQVRASDLESDPVLAPAAPAPRSEPPAPTPVAVAPPPPLTNSQRLELLNRQIEALEDEMPGLGGPIALTTAGFGVSVGSLLIGLALSQALTDQSAATIYYVFSGLAGASGLCGALWWSSRATDREPHLKKLQPLYLQRNKIYWKLNREAGGVSGSLEVAF